MKRNPLFALCVAGVVLILVGSGYALFQQQKEIRALTQAPVAGSGYRSLVAKWSPVVPQVNCNWSDASQDTYGSGTLLRRSNGTFYVLTNAHVVQAGNGTIARNCEVVFPDVASTTYVVSGKHIMVDLSGADAALLQLPKGPFLTNLASTKRKICTIPPVLGDEVLTFGYPTVGSSDGITVTQGIISGDEETDYLSSAIINNGSSGGAAIDVKRDCYFGMPSYTYDGASGSLAGILKLGGLFPDDPIDTSSVTL